MTCCSEGYELGFRTFVLQGGEDPFFTDEKIVHLIQKIKKKYPDCALTLSIGEETFSLEDFESMGGRVWLFEYGLEEGLNLSVSAESGATVLINGKAATTYTVTDATVPVQIIVRTSDTAPIIAVVK